MDVEVIDEEENLFLDPEAIDVDYNDENEENENGNENENSEKGDLNGNENENSENGDLKGRFKKPPKKPTGETRKKTSIENEFTQVVTVLCASNFSLFLTATDQPFFNKVISQINEFCEKNSLNKGVAYEYVKNHSSNLKSQTKNSNSHDSSTSKLNLFDRFGLNRIYANRKVVEFFNFNAFFYQKLLRDENQKQNRSNSNSKCFFYNVKKEEVDVKAVKLFTTKELMYPLGLFPKKTEANKPEKKAGTTSMIVGTLASPSKPSNSTSLPKKTNPETSQTPAASASSVSSTTSIPEQRERTTVPSQKPPKSSKNNQSSQNTEASPASASSNSEELESRSPRSPTKVSKNNQQGTQNSEASPASLSSSASPITKENELPLEDSPNSPSIPSDSPNSSSSAESNKNNKKRKRLETNNLNSNGGCKCKGKCARNCPCDAGCKKGTCSCSDKDCSNRSQIPIPSPKKKRKTD